MTARDEALAPPATGISTPELGIWLFIASEVMLFGALLASWALLRAGDPAWPDQGALLSRGLGSLNTLILLGSSVLVVRAGRALDAGVVARFRRALALASVLGLAFLGVKGLEYAREIGAGLAPSTNNFLGIYFTLTALHGLHLIGGLAVFAHLLGPGAALAADEPARYRRRVRVAALYWYFVDAVWLVLFATLYWL